MKKYMLPIIGLIIGLTTMISCKKSATSSACKIIRIYYTDSASRADFTYDGNTLSRVDYRLKSGESEGYSLYHYTSGKLSGYEDYDSTGVTLRKTEYIYDSNGRLVNENYYVKSGSSLPLSAHYGYEYYSNGNLQKFTRYDNGSTVLETHTYTDYDANGNNIKGYDNNSLGVTVDTFFFTYDNHPNFLSLFFLQGPANPNNPLTHTYKPTVGAVFTDTYIYRYDSKGNVIFQHEAADGEDAYIDYDCGQ
ncbi:MAG: hypothetical protein JWN78_2664 [Bacteroidota bacterium]|nr:hypothetical protein [Bacteroidota bacterium]